ncbi:maleylacetoacetate isomerase [Ferrimonas pelagia]|uniref:Maleylacetoacetate isomerase n=1 Tax=Ferrimonas pelagia TaxID=1177826 RepID=A0ABP9E840_9GAMM
MLKLYGYWCSSAAYRVRIACHHKRLAFESKAVNLALDGGEQHLPGYGVLSPAALIPTLVDGDLILNQSLAIIEYLDEAYPDNPLLPDHPTDRAQVRSMAMQIACDCHPLNSQRVMKYLSQKLKQNEAQQRDWYCHWVKRTFDGLEAQLERTAATYCFGDQLTLVDVCVIPEYETAQQCGVDLSQYERLAGIVARCRKLDCFSLAAPQSQPDALQGR